MHISLLSMCVRDTTAAFQYFPCTRAMSAMLTHLMMGHAKPFKTSLHCLAVHIPRHIRMYWQGALTLCAVAEHCEHGQPA